MKKFIITIALLFVCSNAFAMRQDFSGGATQSIGTATRYAFVHGNGTTALASGETQRSMLLRTGTVRGIAYKLGSAPFTGSSTITLYQNGSPTLVSCTISTIDNTCTNIFDYTVASDGDLFSVEFVQSGVTVFSNPSWTILFEDFDEKRAFFTGMFRHTVPPQTHYPAIDGGVGGLGGFGSEASLLIVAPQAITLTQMSFYCGSGGGATWTATARVNGSDTGLSCSYKSNTTLSCSDTGSEAVVAGDKLSLKISSNDGLDVPIQCQYRIVYTSKYGRYFNGEGSSALVTNSATRYMFLSAGSVTYNASDVLKNAAQDAGYLNVINGMKVLGISAYYNSALTGSMAVALTLRVDSADDTDLQLVFNEFSGQTVHDTGNVNVSYTNDMAWKIVPTSSPTPANLNIGVLRSLPQRRQW